jgi:hypothetical protein
MQPRHPNLIAVPCNNQDDIRKLAEVMKKVAERDPETEKVEGSKTEAEAVIRSTMAEDDIISTGHLRFIHYKGRVTNVCLTKDDFENPPIWTLSMSRATGLASGPSVSKTRPPRRLPKPFSALVIVKSNRWAIGRRFANLRRRVSFCPQ